MQSETISTVISFMNHVLVIIINAALLKAFYCGRRSLTTDFHKITIAMVAIMISGGIVHITVEILLFSYGTTVAESWRICTLSGISNTLFGGMLLGCFLLLSLDRWSKIVRFKPLHPRISLAINLFVILAPLVTVALVFMMGDHSFEPFSSYCLPVFAMSDPSTQTLAPGIVVIALALLFVNLIINFYIKIYLMVRRAGLRVLKLKSKVGESSVISKSHQLSGIKDGQKPATTSAEGSESSGTTRPSVTFILGTGSPSAAVTTAKASNAIAISAAIDGVIVSMGSSTGGQQILSHTHQQHSGTSSAPLNNVNKDICRTTNTSIENAVFRLCLILLLILVVFWTPLLLMMVYELFSQHRAPIWLQIAAFNIVTLDYAFATPIALIRFHKVYRRLWYRHVLPSRMHKWRMVIFVWGEYTASGGGDE